MVSIPPRQHDDKVLADAAWLSRSETRAVFAALAAAGYPARVVGGAVRNALLGIPVADVDVATTALPEAVVSAARDAGLSAHPTGIDHGTITVVSGGVPHEVTTLRRDVATDGRRAVVAFSTDWADDAARRDFTINALYADSDGRVYDPLGTGLADIAARRVRFIGDASTRIREDYLRILRFFRFSAFYSAGRLDAAGLAACDAERGGLTTLSAERVRAELLKILTAEPRPLHDVITAMQQHGYLASLIGAAPAPGRLARFFDLEAAAALPTDPLARLAALALHTTHDAAALSRRLRLSSTERHRLAAMAQGLVQSRAPARPINVQKIALYRAGTAIYRDQTLFAWLGSSAAVDDRDVLAALHLPENWTPPSLPVDGADVIERGVAPGPAIGQILADVEMSWLNNNFAGGRAACLSAIDACIASRRRMPEV